VTTVPDQPQDSVLAVAADAVRLLEVATPAAASPAMSAEQQVSGAALGRLCALLDLQTRALADSPEGLGLIARGVLETWITGHAALLLGAPGVAQLQRRSAALRAQTVGRSSDTTSEGDAPTLTDLARLLDRQAYGSVDPPRAFQRHVASFYEEIDISGVEGTVSRLTDTSAIGDVTSTSHVDHVRVSLWVVLFLAHDHFAAIGSDETAAAARQLFDRLRRVTDDFYAQRRLRSRPSSDTAST
jgi:hypothetical protein